MLQIVVCSSSGARIQSNCLRRQLYRLPFLTALRKCATEPIKTGSGLGKAFFYVFAAATVGAGGTLTYAYVDPGFRKKLEDLHPTVKQSLVSVLGEPQDKKKLDMDYLKDKVGGILPGVITNKSEKSLPPPKEVLPSPPKEKKSDEKAAAPVKQTVDTEKKKDEDLHRKAKEEDAERQKAQKCTAGLTAPARRISIVLEERLTERIISAENAVKAAITAKKQTVVAIQSHNKHLLQAVQDPQTGSKDLQWGSVTHARESMDFARKADLAKDEPAQSELRKLQQLINEGRSNKLTADNRGLLRAEERLTNLQFELQDEQAKISEAETEGKIMTQMKELIEKGRMQFAEELKSILPNVDLTAKGKKLTEDELNALIAHAHLRVDQLRKQLAEQIAREEQHIAQSLDRQKAESKRSYQDLLDREMERAKKQTNIDYENRLYELAAKHEEEMKNQLRRQAAAHSEHLEDVLRVQREQLQLEHLRELEAAKLEEREQFYRKVSSSMAQLEGIEKALEARKELDLENRRAKQLWLACQNLQRAIVHGREGLSVEDRRKPLANEVMAVNEAGSENSFVNTMIKSIPDDALANGVYSEEDLLCRFYKVKNLCRRTALIDENGGTLLQYFLSYLQSIFTFDLIRPSSPLDTADDVQSIGTFEILGRASYFIQTGDYENAIKLMLLLKGEPRRIACDWIKDARVHVETRQAAELLMQHAAATSVRTLY